MAVVMRAVRIRIEMVMDRYLVELRSTLPLDTPLAAAIAWESNVKVSGLRGLLRRSDRLASVRPAWARTYGVKVPCGRTELDS